MPALLALPPESMQFSMPWGEESSSKAFSTARSLWYLQWVLDRWAAGEPKYLSRVLGLSPPFFRARRGHHGPQEKRKKK